MSTDARKKLIAAVHIAKNDLSPTDIRYRAILQCATGQTSCKDCSLVRLGRRSGASPSPPAGTRGGESRPAGHKFGLSSSCGGSWGWTASCALPRGNGTVLCGRSSRRRPVWRTPTGFCPNWCRR